MPSLTYRISQTILALHAQSRRFVRGLGLRSTIVAGVNIGSGPWYLPGWRTVDMYSQRRSVDLVVDLQSPSTLPFADRSIPLVFSSHLLEHLTDAAGHALLNECYRVLEPGGVLRLCVPDAQAAIAAFWSGDRAFFEHGGVWCVGSSLELLLANFFASYRDAAGDHGPLVDETRVRNLAEGDLEDLVSYCVGEIPTNAEYVAHVNGYDFRRLQQILTECDSNKY